MRLTSSEVSAATSRSRDRFDSRLPFWRKNRAGCSACDPACRRWLRHPPGNGRTAEEWPLGVQKL